MKNEMSAADLKARARDLSRQLGRLTENPAHDSDRAALKRELALVEAKLDAAQ